MCYVFKCVGWILDAIQRVLTFALACILMGALCIGVSMAIIAGIAYGYHYSMAEFLTFTRQDVAVYVRRGQFHDKPDLMQYRRTGGNEEDLFATNSSMDYPEQKMKSDSQPLSDAWLQTQDSKNYAQKLTKYSYQDLIKRKRDPDLSSWTATSGPIFSQPKNVLPLKRPERRPTPNIARLTPPTRIMSAPPNPILPTAIMPGRTKIIMRSFKPLGYKDYDPTQVPTTAVDDDFYDDPKKSESISKEHKVKPPDVRPNVGRAEPQQNYVPMRHWGITKSRTKDYTVEDVDEDNIVYKPV